jgi:hypothetical protein
MNSENTEREALASSFSAIVCARHWRRCKASVAREVLTMAVGGMLLAEADSR